MQSLEALGLEVARVAHGGIQQCCHALARPCIVASATPAAAGSARAAVLVLDVATLDVVAVAAGSDGRYQENVSGRGSARA